MASILLTDKREDIRKTTAIIRRGRSKGVLLSVTFFSTKVFIPKRKIIKSERPIKIACLGRVNGSVVWFIIKTGKIKRRTPKRKWEILLKYPMVSFLSSICLYYFSKSIMSRRKTLSFFSH